MENNQEENLPNLKPIDSTIRTEWLGKVTSLLEDLWYPSESDEPITWINFGASVSPPLTVSDLEFYQGIPPEVIVEEWEIESFWIPVTTIEDWFGEDEQIQVAKFLDLKLLLETHLTNWQLFRVGRMEIDLYLLAKTDKDEWGGLKTKIVETD